MRQGGSHRALLRRISEGAQQLKGTPLQKIKHMPEIRRCLAGIAAYYRSSQRPRLIKGAHLVVNMLYNIGIIMPVHGLEHFILGMLNGHIKIMTYHAAGIHIFKQLVAYAAGIGIQQSYPLKAYALKAFKQLRKPPLTLIFTVACGILRRNYKLAHAAVIKRPSLLYERIEIP